MMQVDNAKEYQGENRCRHSPVWVLDHKALLDGNLNIAMAVRRLPLA